MDVAAQIADLDRRVAALENAARGQERYNGRVTELLTELKEDAALLRRHAISTGRKVEEMEGRLASLEARVEKVEARLQKVEVRLEKVEARLEKVEVRLTDIETYLRRDLPAIIAETMREVLREGK
jgi:chromosome segregation ATPase